MPSGVPPGPAAISTCLSAIPPLAATRQTDLRGLRGSGGSGFAHISRLSSVQTPPRELDSTAAVMNRTPRAPSSTEGTRRAQSAGSRPSIRAAISSAQPV